MSLPLSIESSELKRESLAKRRILLKQELKRRREANPLEFYWPHAFGCDGRSCPSNIQTHQDYFGNTYTIEGCPQYYFHKALKSKTALFGSNRSGKTVAGVVNIAFYTTGYYPDWFPKEKRFKGPTKGRVFATDFAKGVGEVIQPAIETWFPEGSIKDRHKNNQGIYDRYWIKHENGTSTFDIMTYEQDVDVAEGASYHWVWYDEPPPRAHRVATARGLIDYADSREQFTLTPLKEAWIYDEIYDNPSVDSFIADMRHNLLRLSPLTNQYIGLTLEKIRENESILKSDELQARGRGKFMFLAGRIFRIWNREIHTYNRSIWKVGENGVEVDGEPPSRWKRIMLIDPHPRRPHAVLWVAQDPEFRRLFAYREGWLKDASYKDVCVYIREKELAAHERIRVRIMDPNFGPSMDGNTKKSVRELFEDASDEVNFPMSFRFGDDHKELARKKIDSDLLFYDKMMPISIINQPNFVVADDMVQCIYQVEHYIWDDYKHAERDEKEKPKDLNSHFPDLLHYLALYNWDEKDDVVEGIGSFYGT